MSDQAPDFPLASMPRMGRRNAIISMPDNWGGAKTGVEMRISPVDSGRRPESAKSERIGKHPSKIVAHELAERALKEAQSEFRKDKLVTRPSGIDDKPKTPINHAVLKEWKKMRESSSAAEGLHAILRHTASPSPTPTPPRSATKEKKVVKKKQHHIRNKSAERGGKSEVGNLIAGAFKQIPHLSLPAVEEKSKHEKQERPTTAERKRVFDVFNVAEITLDSDTQRQRYSDAKIKKEKVEKKEKPTTIGIVSSESDESLVFPKGFVYTPPQPPVGKGPYGKVQAKVNTRWNKYEDLSNNKLSALFERAGSYHEKPTSTHSAGPAQPKVPYQLNTIMKQKHKSASASASVPAPVSNPVLKSKPPTPKAAKSAKVSKTMPSKAITNYPASESLKNHPPSDKLPLTIGPRFNTKKAWGWRTADNKEIVMQHMSNIQANPFHKMKDILTAHQVQQHLPPFPQNMETGPFKSTFYNLQRLNNGKAGATERGANFSDIRRDLTSLINFHVTQKKKSPLVLTTIQAPPSPFLVSNVSVPNQLNAIPVNGELIVPANQQKEKPKGKETQTKKVNNNGGKQTNAKKVQGQRSFNAHPRDYHSPPGRRELRRILRQDAKKEAEKEKHKDTKNPVKLHPAAKPDTVVAKPLNKFHNIYIGPYSGSESEGEQQNSKNTK